MAFSFEEATEVPATPTPSFTKAAEAEQKPSSFTFEEAAAPKPTSFSFEEATKPPPAGPMPGVMEAFGAGLQRGMSDVGQTVTAFSSTAPTVAQEESPAAAPMEWGDLVEPMGKLAPKISYRLAHSSPTLAGGVGAGLAGAAAAGPVGGVVGGIAGSAVGAAVQTLGPVFAQELKKTPNDPDGALDRALESAAISGAFSGAGWALFPVRMFQGPVKQLAFQALGVQPSVATIEKMAHNVHEGKPWSEGAGQAYGEGVAMTAIPALGHKLIEGGFTGKATLPPEQRTTQQDVLFQSSEQKALQAEAFERAATQSTNSSTQLSFRQQSRALAEEAQHELALSNIPGDVATRNKVLK